MPGTRVPLMSLMRFVTADLKERIIVGIEPGTGALNRSGVGARRAVPLRDARAGAAGVSERASYVSSLLYNSLQSPLWSFFDENLLRKAGWFLRVDSGLA